ncbi:type I polyketide synthase [Naumannella huperziae]
MTINNPIANPQDSPPQDGRVAIIGIGCHFPGGVTDPRAFWKLLSSAQDATRDIPEDRWEVKKFHDADRTKIGKTHVSRGGFLTRVDEFDAQFFGISPREAIWLDPQQRLLLRVAFESLEDAGLDLNRLAGTDVGVFMGGFTLDYQLLQNYGVQSRYELQAHSATGMMMTMLSNRISHAFDFTGPSMSVDTACSSSLVAVHLAAQAILRGECHLALAGGVNVMLAPNMTIAESKGGFLSPDGRCKAFDSAADGYGRAEGAGVVVLKPLAQAQADNDPIYAVVLGTAVSQDGRTDGITVPNGAAQQQAIRAAQAVAGIQPAQVQYVEAHGTGTPVGDPIEATAIGSVLAEGRQDDQPIVIGSVKTNIGHLEAAAGVAGLIKTSLALKHRKIPPHLHLHNPNPAVPFERFNLLVPTEELAWPRPESGPRIAGVNSFGFGGTNAHVVLCEAPPSAAPTAAAPGDDGAPTVIPISARTPQALAELGHLMAQRVAGVDEATLRGIGRAAALRRTHHDHRAAVVARAGAEAAERFGSLAAGRAADGLVTGTVAAKEPRVAFVCTGMGPQWWGMGRQLFHSEPVFRAAVERCSDELAKHTGWSLVQELLAAEDASRMGETEVAQPANFAVQVGLAELWKSHGIEPDAVVGHSTGELAAQYLSGVLSFEEAVRVAYHRSRLQQRATGTGRMLAVGLSPETLEKAVSEAGPGVSVAAVNSPSAVTMAGDAAALEKMAAQLETFGVFHKFLQVKVPYHSHLMEPIRDELVAALGELATASATIPLYSTVTGTRIDGAAVDARYWWQNVRATVLFAAAFAEMVDDGYTHFVELGPHSVLAGSMREVLSEQATEGVLLSSMRRGADDQTTFYSALAALHCVGHQISWGASGPGAGALVDLPRYPWQMSSYWNESKEAAEDRHYKPVHPLLGQRLNAPHPTWEVEVGPEWLPGVTDHRIQNSSLVPGAALVEMINAAAADTYLDGRYSVHDLRLLHAISLDATNDPRLRTTLRTDDATIEIAGFRALPGGDRTWTVHAAARIKRATINPGAEPIAGPELRDGRHLGGTEFYTALEVSGFQYGPTFRTIAEIDDHDDTITASVSAPDTVANQLGDYRFHPVLLDAALQMPLVRALGRSDEPGKAFLPVEIRSVTIHGRPTATMQATAKVISAGDHEVTCDVSLHDGEGVLLAEITGYTARSLDSAFGGSPERVNQALYQLEWEAVAPPLDQPPEAASWDGRTFAVFADERGVGDALAEQLTVAGKSVIKVSPASRPSLWVGDDGTIELNPADPGQYLALAQYLVERDVDHLIHLWATNTTIDPSAGGAKTLDQQVLASASVFELARAMVSVAPDPRWRLWLVSRHGQAVFDTETPSPTQAAIWGTGRVLGHQELPSAWGGLIDIDGADVATDVGDIVTAAVSGIDDHNAFRSGIHYTARLDKVPREGVPFPVELSAEASYLVTGGLGALGLVVARRLADSGARQIILMSRTALPDRQDWDELDADHPLAAAVHRVRTLEDETGCRVELAAVDVADEDALRTWMISRSGAPIEGVVHTAGVVDDALIQQMTTEQFERVLRPKISGTWNLHRIFSTERLRFFTMFSSTGAVIASPGQANYAAGNAFIDALAQLRRAQGLPAVSIGWGPWSIGMVEDLKLAALYRRLGIELITPETGAAVLTRYLIDPDRSHVVVISADWGAARKASPTGELAPLFRRLSGDVDDDRVDSLVAQVLEAPADERLDLVTDVLREVVASVLALDPTAITTTESLNAFGLDSMMALEVRNRLHAVLEVDLPVLDLLHGATICDLADRLARQVGAGSGDAHDAVPVPGDELDDELDDEEITAELERLLAQVSDDEITHLLVDLEPRPASPGARPQMDIVTEDRT